MQMANVETNALVGLRKLLPKELFYNTDMDMLGAECEEIRIRAGRNVRFCPMVPSGLFRQEVSKKRSVVRVDF